MNKQDMYYKTTRPEDHGAFLRVKGVIGEVVLAEELRVIDP